jgi:thiamine biosynthesis lipoprotein
VIESVHRFAAMGSECALTITASDRSSAEQLGQRAEATVAQLESLWSRFRPDSELMALNARSGSPFGVSPDTFSLVVAAMDAWRVTGGLFDPGLLDALRSSGYDRSFDELQPFVANRIAADSGDSTVGDITMDRPSPSTILLDDETFFVTLPVGFGLDLGGIGKGRAADLAAEVLARGGAAGGCVDLGGDIAVFGMHIDDQPWAVAVDDPSQPGADLAVLVLDSGAVATSSRGRRQWHTPTGGAHHLIDPRTGAPAVSDVLAVTVVAAEAMWAEVYAKAALIAGSRAGSELLEGAGLSALMVTDDARVVHVGAIDGFMIPMGTSH